INLGGIAIASRSPKDRDHREASEQNVSHRIDQFPCFDPVRQGTWKGDLRSGSKRHLQPGMAGEMALALVEGEEVRRLKMYSGGYVKNVESAMPAMRGSLVRINEREAQHRIHVKGQ